MLSSPRGTHMSCAMPAGGPATTRSGRWSVPTNCWEPANGSSFTTRIAACSFLPTRSSAHLLGQSLETAELHDDSWRDIGVGPGSVHGRYVKWLTFSDLEGSVVEDVRRIRTHPLVPRRIPIYGYVYDVRSGRLLEVPDATTEGRAG